MRAFTIPPALIALVATVEFLCLRFLIRLGPLLPRTEIVTTITSVLVTIGIVALNLAILLMIIALARAAFTAPRAAQKIAFGATSALAVAVTLAPQATPVFVAFIGAAVGTMVVGIGFQALILAVYLFLAYTALSGTLQLALPFTPVALAIAELLAVVAAIAAPFVLRARFDWRAASIALMGAGALAGMWLSVAWLPGTLMIWTVAFTAYLPGAVYVIALGTFLYALTASIFARDARAWGLLLIALGGLRWDYSYYVLLAVTGFWLLNRDSVALTSHSPRV